jgi:hypothetical protein
MRTLQQLPTTYSSGTACRAGAADCLPACEIRASAPVPGIPGRARAPLLQAPPPESPLSITGNLHGGYSCGHHHAGHDG